MIDLREIRMPIVPLIVVGVAVALAAVFMFIIRPARQETEVARNWTTEQAAATRGPGKQVSQEYQQQVQQLLLKEHGNRPMLQRRRDRE